MELEERGDEGSPTPEQEEARRELWRRTDRLQRFSGVAAGAALGGAAVRAGRRRFVPGRRLRRLRSLGIGLVVVVLSVTTCSVGVDTADMISAYGDPVPVSTEAVEQVFQRGADALQTLPDSRRLSVTVTDREATSALGLGLLVPDLLYAMRSIPPEQLQGSASLEDLRRRVQQHVWGEATEDPTRQRSLVERIAVILDPRLGLEDAQVRFSESGQVIVAGSIRAWRWRQPALVVVAPGVEDGRLLLDFEHARLGRLPAPSWLFDQAGRLFASALLMGRDYAEITRLDVEAGRMTFEGRIQ